MVGEVENIQTELSKSLIYVCPLRFGAGIKGKLTEAMQAGTPSVTTPIGAEGMHENLPWNGSVTNDVSEFVRCAVQLYMQDSAWEKAQKNGVDIINHLYNKEVLSALFQHRIAMLTSTLKEHRAANFIGSLLQFQTLRSTKYMSKWIEEKNKGK